MLREEIGLQKNLKANDWSLVYEHVRPRLECDGRKKLRKPTVICVNGTKREWNQCWKEMRRNRNLHQNPYQGSQDNALGSLQVSININ